VAKFAALAQASICGADMRWAMRLAHAFERTVDEEIARRRPPTRRYREDRLREQYRALTAHTFELRFSL
jgi:hypothetical protein